MGDTKKAIKQEIKPIYKNVLADLTEAEQQLTSEEKVELREYIEELSDGHISSFVPIFIRKKIKEVIRRRNGDKLHETGEISSLVDDVVPERNEVNNLQKWYDFILEHTSHREQFNENTIEFQSGMIHCLHLLGNISDNEKNYLIEAFDQNNYYIEDGEVKNAEQ